MHGAAREVYEVLVKFDTKDSEVISVRGTENQI